MLEVGTPIYIKKYSYKYNTDFLYGRDKHGPYKQCQTIDMTFYRGVRKYSYVHVRIYHPEDFDFNIGDQLVIKELLGVTIYREHAFVDVYCDSFFEQKEVIKEEFTPYVE